MSNKKIILLAILLISLFAFSTVNAADNQTDDIIAVDSQTDDVLYSNNLESGNIIDNNVTNNQEVLTIDDSSDEVSLDNNNDEILSYTYPYYYSYNVDVYDTTIIFEDGGTITMYIDWASSSYTYKYYYYLKVYDSDGNEKISSSYQSTSGSSSRTYSINPFKLDPGNYTIKIINYYDDKVMDTAKLTIKARNMNNNSYYALYNKISNAEIGSTIYLDNDYVFDSKTSGISISKQLTIDGKGHSIDGGNLARIFYVTANNVTIKNIVFKNCYFNNGYSSSGGAVYWQGSNGILKNCEFINCSINAIISSTTTSYSYGGAVYWSGSYGKIDNCLFSNCLSYSKTPAKNSYAYGGAVYWSAGDGVINNCNFINCLSKAYSSSSSSSTVYSYGGAVYWAAKDGVVSNTQFSQCYAQVDAYYLSSSSESRGAAICWGGTNGLVNKSYFIDNSLTEKGVIYVSGDYFTVTSSAFLNNYKNGIYWIGSDGSVDNSIFLSNSTYYPVYSQNYQVSADYNWWGNIIDNFDVKKSLPSKINVNNWLYLDIVPDSPLKVGQTGKIKFNLNKLVTNGEVSLYNSKLPDIEVNILSDEGVAKSGIIKNGRGEISYTAANTPNDLVNVTVNNIKKQINITVIKGNSKIIAANLKTVYNGGKYLKITLNDIYGHKIKGVYVSVNLNGKTKKYLTDNNGEVKISTNNLPPKTYTVKISFYGNKNYYKSSTTTKIIVNKATPKFTFSKQSFNDNIKTKNVCVTLKDNVGVVKNVKLSLVVNGKTFNAKTNSNGIAKFKVTNLQKIGTYKATVKFAGNSKYNPASKKSEVIVKKAPKYKIITISTKMSDSGETVSKTYDNFLIQTEKFQHSFTTLCVYVYKDGNMLNRNDYWARFHYKENGVWKWTDWSHGTQAAVYYKYADSIPNSVVVGDVQVKIKV